MLVQILHGNKMRPKIIDYIVSQIKVTAFIQGTELSHCFNKSRANQKISAIYLK